LCKRPQNRLLVGDGVSVFRTRTGSKQDSLQVMKLRDLLVENRSAIVKKWHDLILRTYPEESQGFFRKKDQFTNPVGHAIYQGLPAIYEGLLEDGDGGEVCRVIDDIIRIRAVQDFSPSQAVSFLFALKSVIKEEIGGRLFENGLSEEWAALDAKIDRLALLGFDIYTQCRQKIFDIRVDQVKKRSARLLQMAGLTYEIPEYNGNFQEDEGKPTN
jgi:hypothetical protein